jgi:hypothetical protein
LSTGQPTRSAFSTDKTLPLKTPFLLNTKTENSKIKRVLLALFFALVACGVSFYLISSIGLAVTLVAGPRHPVTSPGLQHVLRVFAAPVSILLGVIAFAYAVSTRRGNTR